MVESLAVKEGLSMVASMGINQIVSESDCVEVIQACEGSTIWWIENAAFFVDCFNFLWRLVM